MRVGSLFSGIGGLDLGLERAGMEIAWQVENDEWCTRVLERHWPDVARFRDVRDCHGEVANAKCLRQLQPQRSISDKRGRTHNGCLAGVDLICGGFPCQPVSHAGRRMGESDSRWLWPEFHRIICEVRPQWVLAENVPGLLSMDSGRLFGGILRDLAEAGYDAVWFVLSAAGVGAPHLRERVFIVAHANESGRRAGKSGLSGRTQPNPIGCGEMAHAAEPGRFPRGAAGEAVSRPEAEQRPGRCGGSDITRTTNADSHPQDRTPVTREECGHWAVEPDVGRVAHGVPARVDRLRGLGNAVVPQVAEAIGRWIMTSGRQAD